MSHTPLAQLAALTDMLFQAEQLKMRDVLQQEAELRRDLASLDAHHAANRALSEDRMRAARQIGADVQWQAWLGRARADLNRQLALCLAQKARMLSALRKAHGRSMAAGQILEQDRQVCAGGRARRSFAQEDTLAMLQRYREAGSV